MKRKTAGAECAAVMMVMFILFVTMSVEKNEAVENHKEKEAAGNDGGYGACFEAGLA